MAVAIISVNLLKCPRFTGLKTLNSSPHSIDHIYIYCWFPAYKQSILGNQVTSKTPSVSHWSIFEGVSKDTGYPHDGRADNAAYRHDRRADKRRYPHDREIDIQMFKI